VEFQTMFYGGLGGAILSLIISIIVYIKLNISEVIEDLTGFSFHKWVKKQRGRSRSKQEQNNKPITREIQPRRDVEMEVAGSGSVDATEILDEEVPSSISIDSTELLGVEVSSSVSADSTELLGTEIPSSVNDDSTEQLEAEVPPSVNVDATELLESKVTTLDVADATELLAKAESDETELLLGDDAETKLLSIGIDETMLLNEGMEETTVLTAPVSDSKFLKERDVVIVHTKATI